MTSYTTRDEAILRQIIEPIESGDASRDEYDIDAIAAEVLDTIGEGTEYRWTQTADDAEFWAAVERHRRPSILEQLNGYDGDSLFRDVIYGLDGYDEDATSEADPNYRNDTFVAAGVTYRYDYQRAEWVTA
ncbi:hypothetical protein ACWJWM_19975 [Clostridioides difficile]